MITRQLKKTHSNKTNIAKVIKKNFFLTKTCVFKVLFSFIIN